jgi:hypothetical protein
MKALLCLVACLAVLACSSETEQSQADTASDKIETVDHVTAVLPDQTVEPDTRNVSCGCALEEVGHCGNYIQIKSVYVEIANGEDHGLGVMEWCGKSGVQVESSGEIKDGKFFAATLAAK